MDIDTWTIFLIAFIHSFVTMLAIAWWWWSSFINQPMMIFFGLPPKQAIATDIVSDITSEIVNIWQFNKEKLIQWQVWLTLMFFSFIWAIFWSYLFHTINVDYILYFLIFVVFIFGIYNFYSVFFWKWNSERFKPKKKPHLYLAWIIFGFIMWWYNNLLSMWEWQVVTMWLIYFFWFDYLQSRWTAQLVFLPARVTAFIFSIFSWILYLPLLILIWIWWFFAWYFWSKLAFKIPENVLKKIFSIVILLIIIKLIYDYFFINFLWLT